MHALIDSLSLRNRA